MGKSILLLSIIAFLFVNPIFKQGIPEREVPSIVKNSFLGEYPNAEDIDWKIDKNLYEVAFKLDKSIENKVWLNSKGKIVKHEEELTRKELPPVVLSKIEADFKGYRIDEVDKVTTDTEVYYEVALVSFIKKNWEITFDLQGKILKQVVD